MVARCPEVLFVGLVTSCSKESTQNLGFPVCGSTLGLLLRGGGGKDWDAYILSGR